MIKPALALHEFCQRVFPGVPKGRMTQIMGKHNGLRQVLVSTQGASTSSRNLTRLQGVSQSISIMVPFVKNKNLCFIFEPPECPAMYDPVTIPLKNRSVLMFRFLVKPALGVTGTRRKTSKAF
jgi:hypothetical protein